MLYSKKTEYLMESIRSGRAMVRSEKLNLIVGLSIPSMLAQISTVMMFFIDASMVGHLGAEASASIGLIESTTWLVGSLLSAAATGFSVQVAHFIGANDFVKARQVFRHALICGLAFSVFLSLIGVGIHSHLPYWLGGGADIASASSGYFLIYSLVLPFVYLYHTSEMMLKSAGNMHTPSVMAVLVCICDVIFNYIFIYICKLGVVGAAMGTALAYICISLPNLYLSACKNRMLNLRQDHVRFHWVKEYVQRACKISIPIAIQNILMSGAQIVSTMIVAPLGNIAIAAHSFAITAESLCYMPGYGIGDAATTLVGQTHGAGRIDLCKNFAYMTVGLGMLVMALMGVIMYVFAPEMIGVLSPVEAIRQLGTTCLRIEAFAEPFFAASIVTYCVCVGAGDTFKPAAINLGTMWLVRLTLAYGLSKSYGLEGVWIAMATELTFRGVLFLIRLFRGSWMKSFQVRG
ncbi:MATE family efflux transporter [Prevotella sp. AM42-24]|jgi:putative MATE family efflux protein|uniref:Multidrug-efflux transporter n=1 Tax=Segatella hominis TaxID=2518605 RepID=A0A4Y8VF83_9BACT|nr:MULTISPECIES: MATE family efflux transporter [Prevotellaceae]RGH43357.1 MATE family efflux transporter [Prevotella sp. AM42-24]TFH79686.1 MATE family efflux transporter [Segatella hominis]